MKKNEKILKKSALFCGFYLTKVLRFMIIVIVIDFEAGNGDECLVGGVRVAAYGRDGKQEA